MIGSVENRNRYINNRPALRQESRQSGCCSSAAPAGAECSYADAAATAATDGSIYP